MKTITKMILVLSLLLPFFSHAQSKEDEINRLNNIIAQKFKLLASVSDTKQASFNGSRVHPTIETIKSLIEQRVQLTGRSMTEEESKIINGDNEYQRNRARLLSTREGVFSEIQRLSPLLITYRNDESRLGIIHGELAGLYIRLASML